MSITLTWNITDLDCLPVAPGTTNPHCVQTLHWECVGTSTEIDPQTNKPCTARGYGTLNVPYDANVAYTPFENLTHEQVLGWAHDMINQSDELPVSQIEAGVTRSVELKLAPAIINQLCPGKVQESS